MNINEIAKLAGVSRATVSRYLNNGYVSEEKKKIIRQVIEETGYQPSSQAQMLRTKKQNWSGLFCLRSILTQSAEKLPESVIYLRSRAINLYWRIRITALKKN